MRGLFALAVLIGLIPVGASAEPFNGPYAGVRGGWTSLSASTSIDGQKFSSSDSSAIVGAVLGYRGTLGKNETLVLGLEGQFDYLTNGSNLAYGVSGIAGIKASDKWMIYARGGYERLDANTNLDGLSVGGGVEFLASESISVRVEFRHIFYEEKFGVDLSGNQATVGLILNF